MRKQIGVLGVGLLCAMVAAAQDGAPSLNLDEYTLVSGPTLIEGVTDNASGVIFDKERDALWVVLNGPTKMVELDRATLTLRRTVILAGFDDTEDLVQLSSNRFAVIEERKQNLVLFTLTNNATSVSRNKSKSYRVDPVLADNLGLEGLTYDKAHSRYLAVKEKDPAVLYQVTIPKTGEYEVTYPWDLQVNNFGMTDFSAMHHHAASGSLLLLSDESKCVVEVTMAGKELSRLELKQGDGGLLEKIPQPEGVTMDDKDRLYICSEPNMLYVFERAGGPEAP